MKTIHSFLLCAFLGVSMNSAAEACEEVDGYLLQSQIVALEENAKAVGEITQAGSQSPYKGLYKIALIGANAVNQESMQECERIGSLREWEKCGISSVQDLYSEFERLCSKARGFDVILNSTIQTLTVQD